MNSNRRRARNECDKETENRGNLKARDLKLIDLVEYQPGAIVSREIVHQKTGTVTIFAFDRGQRLSEHTAPFDALVLVIEGEAEVTISGQPSHRRGK